MTSISCIYFLSIFSTVVMLSTVNKTTTIVFAAHLLAKINYFQNYSILDAKQSINISFIKFNFKMW